MISASLTSWFPNQWSPLAWVFTTAVIGPPAVTVRMPSSMPRVSGTSNSVSTSSEAPSPTTSPALLHPQPPSGCNHA